MGIVCLEILFFWGFIVAMIVVSYATESVVIEMLESSMLMLGFMFIAVATTQLELGNTMTMAIIMGLLMGGAYAFLAYALECLKIFLKHLN